MHHCVDCRALLTTYLTLLYSSQSGYKTETRLNFSTMSLTESECCPVWYLILSCLKLKKVVAGALPTQLHCYNNLET